MAIFYNYIKGCGANAEATNSLIASKEKKEIKDSWSFLKWGDKLHYTKDPIADFKYFENNPTISFNNQPSFIPDSANNPDASSYSTGHILTSAARGQYTYYDLSFKSFSAALKHIGEGTLASQTKNFSTLQQTDNGLCLDTRHFIINDLNNIVSNTAQTMMHLYPKSDGEKIEINYQVNINNGLVVGNASKHTFFIPAYENRFSSSPTILDGRLIIQDGEKARNGNRLLEVWGPARIGGSQSSECVAHFPHKDDDNATIYFTKPLEVTNGYVQAPYFNATSDARAKENIRKADFSALSIVNSLPVYNFNYKNSEKPSIGVIAQEAAEFNVDDFSLVENVEATGENNDYMSVKESKLIYILWKAIQEQQQEIEELKSQLRGGK